MIYVIYYINVYILNLCQHHSSEDVDTLVGTLGLPEVFVWNHHQHTYLLRWRKAYLKTLKEHHVAQTPQEKPQTQVVKEKIWVQSHFKHGKVTRIEAIGPNPFVVHTNSGRKYMAVLLAKIMINHDSLVWLRTATNPMSRWKVTTPNMWVDECCLWLAHWRWTWMHVRSL